MRERTVLRSSESHAEADDRPQRNDDRDNSCQDDELPLRCRVQVILCRYIDRKDRIRVAVRTGCGVIDGRISGTIR